MPTLLSLGHGYSAAALTRLLVPQGWTVIGTTRSAAKAAALRAAGVEPLLWPGDLAPALARATHILASAAPDAAGDPFLRAAPQIAQSRPAWVGYLSTTAVYGDHQGGWVDEDTALTPASDRGRWRVLAETQWRATGLPVHIFRLAGIYGPGRGPFEKVRDGSARRILKPGQVFSRIHVDDIAATLAASIARPNPARPTTSATMTRPRPKTCCPTPPGFSACPNRPPSASRTPTFPPWPAASMASPSGSGTAASRPTSALPCASPITAPALPPCWPTERPAADLAFILAQILHGGAGV